MSKSAFHFPDKDSGKKNMKAPVDQESHGVVDHADAVRNVSAEGAPTRFMQPRNRAGNGRLLPNRQTPVPAGTKPFDGERHNARLHRDPAEGRQLDRERQARWDRTDYRRDIGGYDSTAWSGYPEPSAPVTDASAWHERLAREGRFGSRLYPTNGALGSFELGEDA